MYLIFIGWAYVVLMMAVVEATGPDGSLLGALVTMLLYGVLPLSIVMYLLYTPARRRARLAASLASQAADPLDEPRASAGAMDPDQRSHAAGDAVAPERKEP